MRPCRSTAVASATTSEAPELASIPRWVMCQLVTAPSSALYWHIGATTMRFGRLRPARSSGENSELVMERQPGGRKGNLIGATAAGRQAASDRSVFRVADGRPCDPVPGL